MNHIFQKKLTQHKKFNMTLVSSYNVVLNSFHDSGMNFAYNETPISITRKSHHIRSNPDAHAAQAEQDHHELHELMKINENFLDSFNSALAIRGEPIFFAGWQRICRFLGQVRPRLSVPVIVSLTVRASIFSLFSS